jgi:hypothetical protein
MALALLCVQYDVSGWVSVNSFSTTGRWLSVGVAASIVRRCIEPYPLQSMKPLQTVACVCCIWWLFTQDWSSQSIRWHAGFDS